MFFPEKMALCTVQRNPDTGTRRNRYFFVIFVAGNPPLLPAWYGPVLPGDSSVISLTRDDVPYAV
jgi:hypothetical protein